MPYTVTRSSPDRDLVQTFDTKRQAFTSVGYSIVDNGHGTKAEAQRFAATIVLGEPAEYPPFVFVVEQVKQNPVDRVTEARASRNQTGKP